MLEFSSHQLSRLRPDAERVYRAALTEAYKSISIKLLNSNIVTRKRLIVLIREIQAELYALNADFAEALSDEVADIIAIDAEYTYQELNRPLQIAVAGASLTRLPIGTLKELTDLKTMVFYRTNAKGVTLEMNINPDAMLRSIAKVQSEKVKAIIMAEYAQGHSMETIVRKLRPFVTTKSKANVRTVVRTLLAQASQQASNKFYSENEDYITNYIFVATLDSITSNVCRALDGRRFTDRAQWHNPPLHPNCRSKLNAVSKGYELGERPIVLPDGTIERVKDKGFTYADALKRFPQLANKSPLTYDQYVASLNL